MLNTVLGVVLAAAMIISLSMLTTIEQPPQDFQATEKSLRSQPSIAAPSNESMGAGQLKTKEAPQYQSTLAAPDKISAKIDPVTVGTPFALALLTGVGVFLVVRSRVK